MKKKGFTLIELLAVIVVLAVIALIATPIVLNLVKTAKIGAAEQSVTGYVKSIENTIIKDMLDDKNISDGTYKYYSLEVDVSGKTPTNGYYILEKNTIKNAIFCVDGYTIEYKNSVSKKISDTCEVLYQVYENGTAIYFNPETGKVCNKNDAVSTTGTKTGCMKWYTFNDEGSKTEIVNMILDHNTTAGVAYNSTGSNTEMKEVKTALESDTNTWDKSLKARLITANEIAKITGNTSFDEKTTTYDKWFYLDSNNQTQVANSTNKSKYAWLYDYTNSCAGCNIEDSSTYGYWTSTPVAGETTLAWEVSSRGYLQGHSLATKSRGVRPVITVSKDIFE